MKTVNTKRLVALDPDRKGRQATRFEAGLLHPLIHDLQFGSGGNSGVGKYHGEWGFRAYTNARGVLYHSTRIDLDVRYPPVAGTSCRVKVL